MSTLTNLLSYPVISLRKKFGRRNRACVDDVAPPSNIVPECKYGEYCIKSEVVARDKKGEIDDTFIGYSGDMNITMKTKYACERYKKVGASCSDPTMVIKGGDCKEVILVKNKAGIVRELSSL